MSNDAIRRERLGTVLALARIIVGSSALFAMILPYSFLKTFGISLVVHVVAASLGLTNHLFWRKVGRLRAPDWLKRGGSWLWWTTRSSLKATRDLVRLTLLVEYYKAQEPAPNVGHPWETREVPVKIEALRAKQTAALRRVFPEIADLDPDRGKSN